MTRSLSEAQTALEVQRYRQAIAELSASEPELEPPVCMKHDWRPVRRGPQPRPLASECPGCKALADNLERKPPAADGLERRELPALQDVKRTPAMDSAWAKHLEAQAAAGVVQPDSPEEEEAVLTMDAARERAIRADHPTQGSVAAQRIVNGELVYFRHHPKTIAAWASRGSSGIKTPVWPTGEDDGREIAVDGSARWQR